MLEALKAAVCQANLRLPGYGLVTLTWGNASAVLREEGLVVIKPSGVDYGSMKPEDMVVVDMEGRIVEGALRPSSDLTSHLELYRSFPRIGGVVHTHSTYATSFAQAEREIPCFGTTHADHFHGAVPCTRALTQTEIETGYELNTGKAIVETFRQKNLDALEMPAVLVSKHGPFTWGMDVSNAVENSVVLEAVAQMAWLTEGLAPEAQPAPGYLLEKHYSRKHGPNAYYGQK